MGLPDLMPEERPFGRVSKDEETSGPSRFETRDDARLTGIEVRTPRSRPS